MGRLCGAGGGALMILREGCGGPPVELDPVAAGVLQEDAKLVAHAASSNTPLLFTAVDDGQVIVVGNGQILATLTVTDGDMVRLNEWPAREMILPMTQVTVNDEVRYSLDRTRHGDNRFYFIMGK